MKILAVIGLLLFIILPDLNADAKKALPESFQALLLAIDALAEADERPEGITPEANIIRIRPLFQKIIDAGKKVKRDELNSAYTELGDHFIDDLVAHAKFVIQAIDKKDDNTFVRAAAAYIRWQKWWQANQKKITTVIINKY